MILVAFFYSIKAAKAVRGGGFAESQGFAFSPFGFDRKCRLLVDVNW
jgi:hypothetical protein